MDEIWSFVYARAANVKSAKAARRTVETFGPGRLAVETLINCAEGRDFLIHARAELREAGGGEGAKA